MHAKEKVLCPLSRVMLSQRVEGFAQRRQARPLSATKQSVGARPGRVTGRDTTIVS